MVSPVEKIDGSGRTARTVVAITAAVGTCCAFVYLGSRLLRSSRRSAVDFWESLAQQPAEKRVVSGKQYTVTECYSEALRVDASRDTTWVALGNELGSSNADCTIATVGTRHMAQGDCYVEALSLAPENSVAWCNLGLTLLPGASVLVSGESFTNVQCFEQCLRHFPQCGEAWHHLGAAAARDTTVTVYFKTYTKAQCFLMALRYLPNSSDTWCLLGDEVSPDETLTVPNHGEHTRMSCYVHALELNGMNSAAWNKLGAELDGGTTVVIDGREYTKSACFLKALNGLPKTAGNAWSYLGDELFSDNASEASPSASHTPACPIMPPPPC